MLFANKKKQHIVHCTTQAMYDQRVSYKVLYRKVYTALLRVGVYILNKLYYQDTTLRYLPNFLQAVRYIVCTCIASTAARSVLQGTPLTAHNVHIVIYLIRIPHFVLL